MAPVEAGGETKAEGTFPTVGNPEAEASLPATKGPEVEGKERMTLLPPIQGETGVGPAVWVYKQELRSPELREFFLSIGTGDHNETGDRKEPHVDSEAGILQQKGRGRLSEQSADSKSTKRRKRSWTGKREHLCHQRFTEAEPVGSKGNLLKQGPSTGPGCKEVR